MVAEKEKDPQEQTNEISVVSDIPVFLEKISKQRDEKRSFMG